MIMDEKTKQSNEEKDIGMGMKAVLQLEYCNELSFENKTILWTDFSLIDKMLFVVQSPLNTHQNEVMIYSYISSYDKFLHETSIQVPYFLIDKCIFTTKNDELLFACSNEFRIINWSILHKQIKHTYLIPPSSSSTSILITSIKFCTFRSASISPLLFVSCTDKSLRIFGFETRTFLFLIEDSACWAMGPKNNWYISMSYDLKDNKNYGNIYYVGDKSSQPIATHLMETTTPKERITLVEIARNNMFVIGVTDSKEMLVYSMWNMKVVNKFSIQSTDEVRHVITLHDADFIIMWICGDRLNYGRLEKDDSANDIKEEDEDQKKEDSNDTIRDEIKMKLILGEKDLMYENWIKGMNGIIGSRTRNIFMMYNDSSMHYIQISITSL